MSTNQSNKLTAICFLLWVVFDVLYINVLLKVCYLSLGLTQTAVSSSVNAQFFHRFSININSVVVTSLAVHLGLWVILIPTVLLAYSSRRGLGTKNEEHFVSCAQAPPAERVYCCMGLSFSAFCYSFIFQNRSVLSSDLHFVPENWVSGDISCRSEASEGNLEQHVLQPLSQKLNQDICFPYPFISDFPFLNIRLHRNIS